MRKFNITVNGKAYEVEVEEVGAEGISAPTTAQPAAAPAAKAEAPKQQAPAAPKAKAAVKGAEVKCPMPGTIVAVKVKDGDTVKKGDLLVVLEAMKLENDIVSPVDGVVTLMCAKGDTMQSGDMVAVVA